MIKLLIISCVLCCSTFAFASFKVRGQSVRWPRGVIGFSFSENCSDAVKIAARAALKDWENAANISVYENGRGIIFTCDVKTDTLFAQTALTAENGVIHGAVIHLNPNLAGMEYKIILHEIGHALGLDHSNALSVMNTATMLKVNGLQFDDIAGIESLYGPASNRRGRAIFRRKG